MPTIEASVQDVVRELVGELEGARVLDAGCGRQTVFVFGGAHVTGLDSSAPALSANASLAERIVGDVESYHFVPSSYDVILCWNVLEHLRRPEIAVANMAQALRPGGALVVGMPHVLSAKGLATKLTPFRFHRWIYRRVLGKPLAGTDGRAPFPTVLRLSLRPRAFIRMAKRSSLTVASFVAYRSPILDSILSRNRLLELIWRVGSPLVRVGSAGRIRTDVTDVAIVFTRREQR